MKTGFAVPGIGVIHLVGCTLPMLSQKKGPFGKENGILFFLTRSCLKTKTSSTGFSFIGDGKESGHAFFFYLIPPLERSFPCYPEGSEWRIFESNWNWF